MLAAMWSVLIDLAPWLLLGAAVAGALHVLLPAGFVRRQLQGYAGVLKATLLGVPLPLCSCGVIPAGLGLKKDGASDGASVAFLISTPQTGVDSVLVSAAFLGWPFALFKVASAFVTGLAGGAITEAVGGPREPLDPELEAAGDEAAHGLSDFLPHAVMLLRTIWRWLVFGVVVSAAITVFVPTDLFASLSLSGPIAMLLVLFVSLPMYVCATASVPIAAALVGAGMPAGAALVFLMAGPATNVATMGAIHRGFGRRVLWLYLATIVVGSFGLGLVFDFVLEGAALATAAHHEHQTWWSVASAALLLGLLAWFALDDARRFFAARATPTPTPDAVELPVEGMTCNGCASRLERVLGQVEGVTSAVVQLDAKSATIRGPVDPEALRLAIRQAGFQTP